MLCICQFMSIFTIKLLQEVLFKINFLKQCLQNFCLCEELDSAYKWRKKQND